MKIELKVDGKDVPLNAFTQEIISHVAAAMVESLRGVAPSWKEISIKVRQEHEKD